LPQGHIIKGDLLMRSIARFTIVVLALLATCAAAEPPVAPSSSMVKPDAVLPAVISAVPPRVVIRPLPEKNNVFDKKFISLAIISTGSTFADSYTTLFATQNWRAGKTGVCNMEVQSAYLYGTHPTAGRAYAVASAKSAGALAGAYLLRKHHSKLWSLPLIANSAISLEGVSQNMMACN
jgi:hypothetical protein